MFKVNFKGDFTQRIQKRIAELAANKSPAARIRVPADMKWWYFQEHGTRGKTSGSNGKQYTISAKPGGKLVFTNSQGVKVFADSVPHYGVKPSRFLTSVLPEIQAEVRRAFREALLKGALDSPADFKAVVLHSVQSAKKLIGDSMRAKLQPNGPKPSNSTYPKQSGKLGGQLAADVFERDAIVVDTSEGS
jgi:predicted DNA-binding protein (UPF0278 family)